MIARFRLELSAGCLAISLFLVFFHLKNWPATWDLNLWADAAQQTQGLNLPVSRLFSQLESSPLYSLAFRIYSSLQPDPISLSFEFGLFVTVFSLFLLFSSLSILSGSVAFGLVTALLMTAGGFFVTNPRACHLAVAIACVVITLTYLARTQTSRLVILAIGAYLLTLVRPEFILTLYLSFLLVAIHGATILFKLRGQRFSPDDLSKILILLLVFALFSLLYFIGYLPVFDQSARAFIAFGQHFAVFRSAKDPGAVLPMFNWDRVVAENFGANRSLFAAMLSNPTVFCTFILFNIEQFLRVLFRSPTIMTLSAIVIYVTVRFRTKSNLNISVIPFVERGLPFILILLPSLLSVIWVHPREHYILLLLSLLSLSFAPMISWLRPQIPKFLWALLLVAAFSSNRILPLVHQRNLEVVRAVERTQLSGKLVEVEGGVCYFLRNSCSSIFPFNFLKSGYPAELKKDLKYDAVLVSPLMKSFLASHGLRAEDLTEGAKAVSILKNYTLYIRAENEMTPSESR